MSRATVKAGIVTVIRKHADFTSANAKADDLRVLAKGPARAVRVKYRSHRREEATFGIIAYRWLFDVEVYVPWAGEQDTTQANIDTEVAKVLVTFDAWPKLSATAGVIDAVLSDSRPMEPAEETKGAYWREVLTCEVIEDVARAASE